MRPTLTFVGMRARALARALMVAGACVVAGCQSEPARETASVRPAMLVVENLGHCEWRVTATPAGLGERSVTLPVGATIRLEVPAGVCDIRQEALTEADLSEPSRRFAMPLVAGETYHWRLVTLASVQGEVRR